MYTIFTVKNALKMGVFYVNLKCSS
ncbi:MAG: hypothetical protein K0Q73_8259, partial [Paenibacillus sp.]|nr:hypothetical protein [Paenibacillus sp.]